MKRNYEYYNILGIKRNASLKAIKKAFTDKAKALHPDQGGNAEEFKLLVEAYEVLGNAFKRDRYDKGKEIKDEYLAEIDKYILMVFESALNYGPSIDHLRIIKKAVEAEIDKHESNVCNLDRKRKTIQTLMNKFITKKNKENIFNQYLVIKDIELSKEIEQEFNKCDFKRDVLSVLREYSYRPGVAGITSIFNMLENSFEVNISTN